MQRCGRGSTHPDTSHQVGFSGNDAVIKDEVDASPSVPEVAAMPALSNMAPQQYRTLLHKRFAENKDNVLAVLATYKDRLEGELQFLSRSVSHPIVVPMQQTHTRFPFSEFPLQCATRQLP